MNDKVKKFAIGFCVGYTVVGITLGTIGTIVTVVNNRKMAA